MMRLLLAVVAAAALAARGALASSSANNDDDVPAWQKVLPDRIGARSPQCDQSVIKKGQVGKFLCDTKLNGLLDKVGFLEKIDLGPCSAYCRTYGCALLAMGCEPEYRALEQQVGDDCDDQLACGDWIGLEADQCEAAASFLAWTAPVPQPDFEDLIDPKSPFIRSKLALCNDPALLAAISNLLGGSNAEVFGRNVTDVIRDYVNPCGDVCMNGVCALALIGCEDQADAVRDKRDVDAVRVCPNTPEAAPLQCAAFEVPCKDFDKSKCAAAAPQNCPPKQTPWHAPAFMKKPDTRALTEVEECCETVCDDLCAAPRTCKANPSTGAGGPTNEPPITLADRPACRARGDTFDVRCNAATGCYYCTDPCVGTTCPGAPQCSNGDVLARLPGQCCPQCVGCSTYRGEGLCAAHDAALQCPAGETPAVRGCTGAGCSPPATCCNTCATSGGATIDTPPSAPPAGSGTPGASSTQGAGGKVGGLDWWAWLIIGIVALCCCLVLVVLVACFAFRGGRGGDSDRSAGHASMYEYQSRSRSHSAAPRARSRSGTHRSRSNTRGGGRSRGHSRAAPSDQYVGGAGMAPPSGFGGGGGPATYGGSPTYGDMTPASTAYSSIGADTMQLDRNAAY